MTADFIVRTIDPVADGPALHAIYGDEASCHYLSRPATASVADTIAMMQGWMARVRATPGYADIADLLAA